MSRIGKAPINIPAGVEINVASGNLVTVKGPKGELTQQIDPDLGLKIEDGILEVTRPTEVGQRRVGSTTSWTVTTAINHARPTSSETDRTR